MQLARQLVAINMNSIQDKLQEYECIPMDACTIKVFQSSAVHSAMVGQTSTFSLLTFYGDQQPCIEQQNVKAELVHHSRGKVLPCTVKDSDTRGTSVSVNGKNIIGSPFEVTLYMSIYQDIKPELTTCFSHIK